MRGSNFEKFNVSVNLAFLFFTATFFQGIFCESQNHGGSSAINSFDLSAVFRVQGNVYPDGYFYTTLNIGTPPRPYHLDIDTGSDLTWVNCDAPCVNCPKSPHKPYKPQGNNALPCKHSLCAVLQHSSNYPCHNPSDQCDYEVEYADHGSSIGVLVRDNFPLQYLNGSTTHTPLVFGCGYDQDLSSSTEPPFVDGVLGLGNGKSSILSQLNDLKVTKNVFGHCLSDQGGYLFLGDTLIPSGTVWVPMLKKHVGNYYSIGPAELLLDGKNVFKGGLSFVLDSGSTYTYLSSKVYEAALSMIKKNINRMELKMAPEDKTLPICWKGVKPFKSINDVKKFFKHLALRFSKPNNAMLEMSPEVYLIVNKLGNVCLGILNGAEAGLDNLNVLGDISLLNKMIIYNNDKSQIGWTTVNCDRLPNLDRDSDIDFYRSEYGYDEL